MGIRFLNLTAVTTNAGAPSGTADEGTLVVDTTNDVLYVYSGGAWVQAGGGGGGSAYLVENYDGAFPTVTGADALAIGELADGTGVTSIAIGRAATANNLNSTALGTSAIVSADNSIQLGNGTNSTASTLQFLTNQLANAQGLYTSFTAPTNYTPADNDNITSHLTAIDTALGTAGGGEPYVEVNSVLAVPSVNGSANDTIAIGPATTAGAGSSDGVVIGNGASIGTNDINCVAIGEATSINGDCNSAVAIGPSVTISNNSDGVVAIGSGSSVNGTNGISIKGSITANSCIAIGSSATASANSAVQIGSGTNSTASTLQFLTQRLANAQGLYTSFTAPSNYTPADNDNVTSHFQAIDTALGAVGGGSPLTTKGDIFTYDTADARLPVGTDGQILVANSATATGLEWQTTSSEVLAGGFSTPIGNGALTSITVNHGLGTRNLHVTVYRNSSPYDEIICDIEHTDADNVELGFTVAPTTDEFICYVSIGGGRETLLANRTYYVATTGSDSNDGLTVGNPFLTIQKAIDTVAGLDIGIYDVDIQLADGTYNIATTIQLKTIVGSGQVFIKGNNGTPANVVLNGSVDVIRGCYIGDYKLQDFTIQTSSGNCIYIFGCKASTVRIENLRFGTCPSVHMALEDGPIGFVEGDYEIFGGASFHLYAITHSSWNYTRGGGVRTITLTGTPNFSGAFAIASRLGGMTFTSTNAVWSGSATGQRYTVDLNAVIDTNGAGATYLPGNSAGSSATGGQYA